MRWLRAAAGAAAWGESVLVRVPHNFAWALKMHGNVKRHPLCLQGSMLFSPGGGGGHLGTPGHVQLFYTPHPQRQLAEALHQDAVAPEVRGSRQRNGTCPMATCYWNKHS